MFLFLFHVKIVSIRETVSPFPFITKRRLLWTITNIMRNSPMSGAAAPPMTVPAFDITPILPAAREAIHPAIMAMDIVATGTIVEIMPVPIPFIMTVAEPVSDALAMLFVGL